MMKTFSLALALTGLTLAGCAAEDTTTVVEDTPAVVETPPVMDDTTFMDDSMMEGDAPMDDAMGDAATEEVPADTTM